MKRAAGLLLAFLLLAGCTARSPEQAARIFHRNRAEFEEAAQTLLTGGGAAHPPGVSEMAVYEGCVDFYMGGFGLAPSSVYWGVAYTADDRPVGFQGFAPELTADGEGWRWQEEGGDNRLLVEKLDDCWYLYEMKF